MTGKPTIEPRDGYILVRIPEDYELTGEGAAEHWGELLPVCAAHQCAKVLSVGRNPVRRMGVMDAYESGVKATEFPMGLKVACVWENYSPDELTRFFQTVASNRGAQIEFFPSLSAAAEWLGIKIPIELDGV